MKKILLTGFIAMTLAAAPAFAQDGAPNGANPPPPAHGHCMPGGSWHHGGPMHMFDKMDTNHDGKISQAEFMAAQQRHFAKMDLNHDGFITRQEMHEVWKMHMERHGHGDWQRGGHEYGHEFDQHPGFDHGPGPGMPNAHNFQSGAGYKAPQAVPDYSHSNDDNGQ